MPDPIPTKSMFAGALHSSFRLFYQPDQCLELENQCLVLELVALNEGPSSPRQEAFSLIFTGPGQVILPQHIYPFEHDQMGCFELFIVPTGRNERGVQYEAVFNRLLTQGGY